MAESGKHGPVQEKLTFLMSVAPMILLAVFQVPKYFADGNLVGGLRQPVPAFGTAPRFDEAALLQSRENQLQKLLGNFLTARDVGDLHRLPGGLRGQVEDSL